MYVLSFVLNAIVVSALSPLAVGLIRTLKARIQVRVGADPFQPYRDLSKLFRKDEVISEDASWIFTASPYIVFGTTLALAAGVPILSSALTFAPLSDMLVFVYMLAVGTFFLALSGIDAGSGFGGFGASREMTIAALTEGGLILSLAALALLTGSSMFLTMASVTMTLPLAKVLPLIIAAAAFFIALLAENARYPVDNPATHLELTMVHEAMLLEHSGKGLALMEWSASNKLLIFTAIFVNVFLPWGSPTSPGLAALFVGAIWFALKTLAVLAGIACIESGMAKFRIFRVPDLLFTSFVLSVIAIVLTV